MAFRSEYQDWARELSRGPRPVIWPLVKLAIAFAVAATAAAFIAIAAGAYS